MGNSLHENFSDITFRILLVDDGVGVCNATHKYECITELKSINIKKCEGTCSKKNCKLKTIEDLLKEEDIKIYWKKEDIEKFHYDTIIKDFIDNDDNSILNNKKKIIVSYETGNENKNENITIPVNCEAFGNLEKVQIIGVRDIRTALLLMSKFKFDLIFFDYLLYYKENGSNSRDYSNQFFDFLSKKRDSKTSMLENLRQDVLDNRGPLGKMWVMPITGFNQTFIQDLYRNKINLIDYRWNISHGADPITTPWQFLYHLNKLIELQLRSCTYTIGKLLKFILYTCQDLEMIKNSSGTIDFDTFQSFMGSEYATLMQLYGNKLPIKRDAKTEEKMNPYDKSVFATYIWNKFYANQNRKFVNEIELCRLMQRFYHQAATMYKNRDGRQRLNEAFENLSLFVKTNYKSKNWQSDKKEELLGKDGKGLVLLKEVIDNCTHL